MNSLRLPSFWPDAAQRLAEQAFDGRSVELGVCAQLGEHGLHLTLAKAEVAQGGEDLGVCVDAAWVYCVAVSGAIRMAEDQSAVGPVVDEQLAAMGAFMEAFHKQLVESGEHVDSQGHGAPVHTRTVRLGPDDEAPVALGQPLDDAVGRGLGLGLGLRDDGEPPGGVGAEAGGAFGFGPVPDARPLD